MSGTTENEQLESDNNNDFDVSKLVNDIHGKFNKFAGLEKLEGFSIHDLLSDIFKRHEQSEKENFFSVGTEFTTPKIENVDISWPRPWMFFRALSFSGLLYFMINVAWEMFKNINLIPGLMAMGTVAVPISALIFFFEVNIRRNISLYVMIRMVLLGGITSLMLSLMLFSLPLKDLDFLGASIAGPIEECGKLMALILIARSSLYKYKINGLLLGASIGTGFAIFESLGYAFTGLILTSNKDSMTDIILLRGALSPFAHIAWTAIAGAALWRVKKEKRFSLKMLTDGRFWHLFIIPVVLHMVWNSDFQLPYLLKQLVLGAIAWGIILALIQEGIKEIRMEKLMALEAEAESENVQD